MAYGSPVVEASKIGTTLEEKTALWLAVIGSAAVARRIVRMKMMWARPRNALHAMPAHRWGQPLALRGRAGLGPGLVRKSRRAAPHHTEKRQSRTQTDISQGHGALLSTAS